MPFFLFSHAQKDFLDVFKDYLSYMLKALRKLPTFKGVAHRGNDNRAIVKKGYRQGREIFWSGFTSTTLSTEVAKEFAGKGGVVFNIKLNSGKNISSFSTLGREDEIILTPNTGLIVARELYKNPTDGYWYVDLVEKTDVFVW